MFKSQEWNHYQPNLNNCDQLCAGKHFQLSVNVLLSLPHLRTTTATARHELLLSGCGQVMTYCIPMYGGKFSLIPMKLNEWGNFWLFPVCGVWGVEQDKEKPSYKSYQNHEISSYITRTVKSLINTCSCYVQIRYTHWPKVYIIYAIYALRVGTKAFLKVQFRQ